MFTKQNAASELGLTEVFKTRNGKDGQVHWSKTG